jgi:tetratricopeptide (TPR) repeat protein
MRRLARIVPSAAALLLLTLLASSRVAAAASKSTCVNGGQQNPDISAGKAALQQSPTRLGKRMELANLLEKRGCFDEAVHLLEEGQKYNPFSPTLLFSLRRARNMAREEHYLEGIDQAEAGARLNRQVQALQSQRQALKGAPKALAERPTQVAAVSAEAEAMVEPQNFSNLAEATRSN